MNYGESLKVIRALHHIKEARKRIPCADMETAYELNQAEIEILECLVNDTKQDIEAYLEHYMKK